MTPTPPVEVPQVLNEIRTHGGLKLSAVGRLFPAARGDGPTNPAKVWRWAHEGAKTPTGARVKLEVVKVGMSWLKSQAAVDRFVTALTAASIPAAPATPARTPSPSRIAASAARASKKLQSMKC
jgi:hypothetical protein